MGCLTIVGVQEHGVEGELGSDSLDDIKEVEHLLNRLVSLLSHTSIDKEKLSFVFRSQSESYLWTGRLPSLTPRRATVVKYLSIIVLYYLL